MFKRILMVLERGPLPSSLLQVGLDLARSCRADILFLSSCANAESGSRRDGGRASPAGDEGQYPAEQVHVLARRRADEHGVMSCSVLAAEDLTVGGILDAAAANRCDAIVLASEGSNAVVRLLRGSVIPGLVTASPIPVIVCPRSAPQEATAPPVWRRILVLLEDGELAQTALRHAVALATDSSTEMLLVHVMPPDLIQVVDVGGYVPGSLCAASAEIQRQSNELIAFGVAVASRAGARARGLSLKSGTTASDLARLASERQCDWIVAAHRDDNAVVRLVTSHPIPGLITDATVPILICRETRTTPRSPAPRRRLTRQQAAAAAAAARAGGR